MRRGNGCDPEGWREAKVRPIRETSPTTKSNAAYYAGLEALKLGRRGDRRISDLPGLDPHTVGQGAVRVAQPGGAVGARCAQPEADGRLPDCSASTLLPALESEKAGGAPL